MVSSYVLGLLLVNFAIAYEFRSLGFFKTPSAAFTYIGDYFGDPAIYVTNFGSPFAGGTIEVAQNIDLYLGNITETKIKTIARGIVWPNEAVNIPDSVFGPNHIVVCGGFIPPFAHNGSVTIVDMNTGIKYVVSELDPNFFYHQAEWIDMDGDGLLDILTTKVNYPTPPLTSKMVWYKNPGKKIFPWAEHLLIKDGPEVFFRLHDFDNDGIDEIIATLTFKRKLSIFFNHGNYLDPNSWKELVVDSKIGAAFDIKITDLNNDGKEDLVVTNHQSTVNESAVFAYEIPRDIFNGIFTRHIIAAGFITTQPGNNQASPGSPHPFFPVTNRSGYEKPHILVAGDGTQRAHLLTPVSQWPNNWEYKMETVHYGGNTVGGVSVGDVDSDGYSEMFIPVYENGEVHVFTFSPQTNNQNFDKK